MELRNDADCRAVQLRNESLQRYLTYVRCLIENLQLEMESRPIEFILFKQSIQRSRQIVLLQMLSVMIAALQDQGYRFSDLLKALSDYAAGEKDKVPEDSDAWQTVSYLLQMAAEEAEQKDRELP